MSEFKKFDNGKPPALCNYHIGIVAGELIDRDDLLLAEIKDLAEAYYNGVGRVRTHIKFLLHMIRSIYGRNLTIDISIVCKFGADKYGFGNYKLGTAEEDIHRYLNALTRHIYQHCMGEDKDKESDKSHLLHAAANCVILLEILPLN